MRALPKLALALACSAASPHAAAAALAQVDKPVRLLVGFAPGGSADIAARLVADRMKDELKQPVVVENRPGAGGRLVAEAVKNAPADGSVLMLTPIVVTVLAPMVFSKLPYDPIADFAPVAQVANFQFALSVNASPSGEEHEGPGRLVQGQPGQGELRQPGAGQPAALLRRDDRQGRRRRAGARAVQRRRADDERADGRPAHAPAIDTTVEQVELHRTGRVRILGHLGRDAQRAAARGADVRRIGPRRRRRARRGSRSMRRRRRPRRRCASSTPRSTRRSPAPSCASASPSSASSRAAARPPTSARAWPRTRRAGGRSSRRRGSGPTERARRRQAGRQRARRGTAL